jgi:iron complex outermembrane receptor protein
MKQYFTKRTPLSILLLLLLACHPFLMAQSLAYVQQNKPDLEAKTSTPSNLIRLKDALNELSQEYQVSILFEDVTVKGLQTTLDKIKGGKLESKLEKLLKPHQLTFQKVNKNAPFFVVISAKM